MSEHSPEWWVSICRDFLHIANSKISDFWQSDLALAFECSVNNAESCKEWLPCQCELVWRVMMEECLRLTFDKILGADAIYANCWIVMQQLLDLEESGTTPELGMFRTELFADDARARVLRLQELMRERAY